MILPRPARFAHAALVTVALLLAVFGAASVRSDHFDPHDVDPIAALDAASGHAVQVVAPQPAERGLRLSHHLVPVAGVTLVAALLAAWAVVVFSGHGPSVATIAFGWSRRGPPLPFSV